MPLHLLSGWPPEAGRIGRFQRASRFEGNTFSIDFKKYFGTADPFR
jgi:hypothetical protein